MSSVLAHRLQRMAVISNQLVCWSKIVVTIGAGLISAPVSHEIFALCC
jgi:hypothetical protein